MYISYAQLSALQADRERTLQALQAKRRAIEPEHISADANRSRIGKLVLALRPAR